jgi:hypothetical protein
MPTYIYKDTNGHITERTIPITSLMSTHVKCELCQLPMWRVPQIPMVNWNGLPPHLEHLRPRAATQMIQNEERNRYNYLAFKEEHEKIQTEFERKELNDGKNNQAS